MAAKKNQHYVPQYYFKYFNNQQRFISILLVNDKKIINKSSVADQASLPYFYGDSSVEDKICVIENSNRQALNEILNEKKINKKLKKEIIESVLFQHSRTEKSRKLMRNGWKAIEAFTDFHKSVDTENDAKRWLSKNSLDGFDVDEKIWHQRQLSMLKDASWQLSDLDYLILNNESEIDFVFSDAPVVYLNPFMGSFKEKGTTGTLSKGLIVAYPISNKLLILFFENQVYSLKPLSRQNLDIDKVLKVDGELVKYFNYLQFLNAESCVYSNQIEALTILQDENGREATTFTCNIELKNEGQHNTGVLFSGALNQTPDFPSPPFFEYKIAKKFRYARPKALQTYKKLDRNRLEKILSKEFRGRMARAKDFDEMFALLRLNG